jgi:hypothetical protein
MVWRILSYSVPGPCMVWSHLTRDPCLSTVLGRDRRGLAINHECAVTTDEAVERFSAQHRREEFLAELKRALPSFCQDELFLDIRLRILKPHNNRVTFEMSFATAGGFAERSLQVSSLRSTGRV